MQRLMHERILAYIRHDCMHAIIQEIEHCVIPSLLRCFQLHISLYVMHRT